MYYNQRKMMNFSILTKQSRFKISINTISYSLEKEINYINKLKATLDSPSIKVFIFTII
jgi:hypothetical protein